MKLVDQVDPEQDRGGLHSHAGIEEAVDQQSQQPEGKTTVVQVKPLVKELGSGKKGGDDKPQEAPPKGSRPGSPEG